MGGRNEGEDSRIGFIYEIIWVRAKRDIFNDHGRPRSNGEANIFFLPSPSISNAAEISLELDDEYLSRETLRSAIGTNA